VATFFLRFYVFLENRKKHNFLLFLRGCTRFLEHCGRTDINIVTVHCSAEQLTEKNETSKNWRCTKVTIDKMGANSIHWPITSVEHALMQCSLENKNAAISSETSAAAEAINFLSLSYKQSRCMPYSMYRVAPKSKLFVRYSEITLSTDNKLS